MKSSVHPPPAHRRGWTAPCQPGAAGSSVGCALAIHPASAARPDPRRFSRREKGVAIIAVLALLALITILVLTFFTRVRSGTADSGAYSQQANAEQLGGMATQLVEAQIRTATTGGIGVAWASQPGMIRTWDISGAFPTKNYRLYSWDSLVADGSVAVPFLGDSVSNWKDTTRKSNFNALWCDLNSPVAKANPATPQGDLTTLNYPILAPPKKEVDPSTGALTSRQLDPDNGMDTNDPIADPSNTKNPGIQGYSVVSPASLGFVPKTAAAPAPGPDNNPVPMPVRWLYVLQDGTVAAPAAGGSPDKVIITEASATNPITGRIAYWTDDETCKLNLNTASEGSFWSVPKMASNLDAVMSRYQPQQNEYQRYPGHPATVCLSTVFPDFSPLTTISKSGPPAEYYPNAYDLIPRISAGGSLGGTRDAKPVVTKLQPDTDRLFASVDEFFYRPLSTGTNPASRIAATSIIHPTATTDDLAVTKEINQKRFFLTASSRAPETTIFNTPRISLWPTTTDSIAGTTYTNRTRMDAFDKLLAFCGTLWSQDYFFSRADARSPTFDYTGIKRNREVYAYLRTLTETSVPGYGGNFSLKYGSANRDELLTQAFDYVRAGPELNRVSDMMETTPPAGQTPVTTMYPCYTLPAKGSSQSEMFSKLVVPIQITSPDGTATKGMGNLRYISSIGFGFFTEKVEIINADKEVVTANPLDPNNPKTTAKRIRYWVRPQLLVTTHAPTTGWARAAVYVNPKHTTKIGEGAALETRSIRYRATFTDSGAPTLSAVAEDLTAKGVTISGGTIDFPWGSPCEMTVDANGAYTFDSWGADLSSPTSFLVNSTNSRTDAIPMQNSGASTYRDGTPASLYSYAYRAASPIVMEFDLPPKITEYKPTGSATEKNKFYRERLGAMLTRRNAIADPGTKKIVSYSENVGNNGTSSLYEDFNDNVLFNTPAPPDVPMPRMAFSGATLEVQLAFTEANPSKNEFPVSDVLQTLQVKFPPIAKLPVPSQTYSVPRKTGDINYLALASSSLPISTWAGNAFHTYLALDNMGFANRYTKSGDINDKGDPSAGNFADIIQPGDVVRGMELDGASTLNGALNGDWRLAALQPGTTTIPSTWFAPPVPPLAAQKNGYTGSYGGEDARVHSFVKQKQAPQLTFPGSAILVSGVALTASSDNSGQNNSMRMTSSNMSRGIFMADGVTPGDWNNLQGEQQGGAIFTMPDFGGMGRGTLADGHRSYFGLSGIGKPEDDGITDANQYQLVYSPNRQMYSPMQLGTLLTEASGVTSAKPWQTLLFCPNSPATIAGFVHPGKAKSPPDHLFADLFWMPVVDPYPISESLTTAGKINLNYQIEPFRHITRATGMYALMKSTQITALPNSVTPTSTSAPNYKPYNSQGTFGDWIDRYPIAINETLKAFQDRYSKGNVFPTASAICEMFLYPAAPLGAKPPVAMPTGPALVNWTANDSGIINWWQNYRVTADNEREEPYAYLYQRLTTKSNTFTVHIRAQSLKQRPGTTNWNQWEEGKDNVVSEYRGSETIERYIDPKDPKPTDYLVETTTPTGQPPFDSHYRFRTLQKSRFTR